MAFSFSQLRTWKTFSKTSVNMSDWRTVSTAAQPATATSGLPRFSKWGSTSSANDDIPSNGTMSMDKLQHAHFDAAQVRFRFYTTEPEAKNAISTYWSPREATIYNGGSFDINTQGDLSKQNEWITVRDGTTPLMRIRGYYSGRYQQSGAWYGSNTLKRIYYDIYQPERMYLITNNSSNALCGFADTYGLGTTTNSYQIQTSEYCSIVIKNRQR
ncbi:hypothetical protein [Vibrio parahaemolyticus]|uniref:hypothetical protein n=1 Tax=Vibrio parahaemolyticus TaxID=670 RepID=UPI001EEA2B9D|nr:hypothetical protein [Vibrio parahaemolyticus]MCG6440355.1 hypothetical protein [Vibrio parahaemolyticus]MCG6455741.1 hypothetical protein [Vibrio parahaemolyticus]